MVGQRLIPGLALLRVGVHPLADGSWLALRFDISRRAECHMSCKAVLQYQILQCGQKGCMIFELRLSRVPQAFGHIASACQSV